MPSEFVSTLRSQPLTLAHVVLMAAIFLYQFNYDVAYEKIGVQYERLTVHREWWRVLTATYSHLNVLHIAFNMMSLWEFGRMEAILGSLAYLRYSLVLVVCSNALMLAAQYLQRRYRGDPQISPFTVGYSGVVFGWMAAAALIHPVQYSLFGLNFPSWVTPFLSLFFVQLLIRRTSFLGHLSGIIVGFAIGGGVFRWFDNYLALCTLIWVLIGALVSLKLSGPLELSCIQITDPGDVEAPRADISIVNGAIIYNNQAPDAEEESL